MKSSIAFISLAFLLCSCTNPVNRVTFQKYYSAAEAAEKSGNYEQAREYYWRAYVNTQIGNLEKEAEAASAFSFGRMLGITCHAEKAEEFLLLSLEKSEEIIGTTPMIYNELARLNMDQKKYAEAAAFYEKSFSIIDNPDAIESDPVSIASLFEEYSKCLDEINRSKESQDYRDRASSIRDKYIDTDKLGGRKAYMSKCIPLSN